MGSLAAVTDLTARGAAGGVMTAFGDNEDAGRVGEIPALQS